MEKQFRDKKNNDFPLYLFTKYLCERLEIDLLIYKFLAFSVQRYKQKRVLHKFFMHFSSFVSHLALQKV